MTTFTSRGIPILEPTDTMDLVARQNPLAQFVHDRPGVSTYTTTQRNALAGVELWDGRLIVNTTTDRVERYDLGLTTWTQVADFAEIAALLATTGTPAALGLTASRGVATSAARSDHVHAWPAYAAVTPTISGVTVSSAFGRWVQRGKDTTFRFIFTINAAPTGTIGITLPATAATPTGFTAFGSYVNIGWVTGFRSGVASHNGSAYLASATVVNFLTSGAAAAWNATSPATWVSGDIFSGEVFYEAA